MKVIQHNEGRNCAPRCVCADDLTGKIGFKLPCQDCFLYARVVAFGSGIYRVKKFLEISFNVVEKLYLCGGNYCIFILKYPLYDYKSR